MLFLGRSQAHIAFFPPVQLGHLLYTRVVEQFLVAQWAKEVRIGVLCLYFGDCRKIHMIVVVVRCDDGIHYRDIFDLTGNLRVSLWAEPREGAAPFREDRIEENSQASRKLDEIACVSEPCCS